jgi:hypothetical protein
MTLTGSGLTLIYVKAQIQPHRKHADSPLQKQSAMLPVEDYSSVAVHRAGSLQTAQEQLTCPVQLLIGCKGFIYKRHGFTNK